LQRLLALKRPRHHRHHHRLLLPGDGDRSFQRRCQRGIGSAEIQVLVVAEQLITKLIIPRLQR
jgi:hypothetical protein